MFESNLGERKELSEIKQKMQELALIEEGKGEERSSRKRSREASGKKSKKEMTIAELDKSEGVRHR